MVSVIFTGMINSFCKTMYQEEFQLRSDKYQRQNWCASRVKTQTAIHSLIHITNPYYVWNIQAKHTCIQTNSFLFDKHVKQSKCEEKLERQMCS